ncbi:hypothetical protein ACFTAO_18390 [Paenibacillus rhizoplanae]
MILLLSALSVLYLYLTDWMLGYGLGNISYILNYLLYTTSEKADCGCSGAASDRAGCHLLGKRPSARPGSGEMITDRRYNNEQHRNDYH